MINLQNAVIDKITTMKDGSLKITLVSRELPPTEMAALFLSLHQEETVEFSETMEKGKSPSQRLKSVLFLLWKQEGEQGVFENYYRDQMEKIIDHYKNKLDEKEN